MKNDNVTKMPFVLRLSMVLVVLSVFIGILLLTLRLINNETDFSQANSGITFFISFGLPLILVYYIHKRMGWARIALLTLYVVEMFFNLTAISTVIQQNFVYGVLNIIQSTVYTGGVIVLFFEEANEWFKSEKNGDVDSSVE